MQLNSEITSPFSCLFIWVFFSFFSHFYLFYFLFLLL
jgi:hypothetical protein